MTDKVSGFAQGITNTVKDVLKISSPSKEARALANFFMEGFGVSFENDEGNILKKVEAFASKIIHSTKEALDNSGLNLNIMQNTETMEEDITSTSRHENIKKTLFEQVQEIVNGVMEIVTVMISKMDVYLRTEGYNTGRNFMRALGDALIDEEARLLSQALGVANSIRAAFREAQDAERERAEAEASSSSSMGPAGAPTANITQNFYRISDNSVGFDAYRGTKKAADVSFR